jgi:hypothetical protein
VRISSGGGLGRNLLWKEEYGMRKREFVYASILIPWLQECIHFPK